MKRSFGLIEVIFYISYLLAATVIGAVLLSNSRANPPRMLAGIMALVLVSGDAFHLLPRIKSVISGKEEQLKRAIGTGKQITSVTMTIFYVLLWHLGLILYSSPNSSGWSFAVYLLALIRILLCLLPQNKWTERYPPVRWGILRNIPLFMLGLLIARLFFIQGRPARFGPCLACHTFKLHVLPARDAVGER